MRAYRRVQLVCFLCVMLLFIELFSLRGFAKGENETEYELCINGITATLNDNTGYVKKNLDTVMVPIGCILTLLNETYEVNKKKTVSASLQNGTIVQMKPEKTYCKVNDTYIAMTHKNEVRNGVLMVSMEILPYLNVTYQLFECSQETKEKGYSRGVLAMKSNTKDSMDNSSKVILDNRVLTSEAATLTCANDCTQLVTVKQTKGSTALVCFHEKRVDGIWEKRYETKGYIGRKGLGKTVRGDEKTPVGAYHLTTPFGRKKNPGTSMKYTKVTKYHYWSSDDSKSYSNQLVDVRKLGMNSVPGEHLISCGKCYNYGIFIDYNKKGTLKKGSCIFLHCFSGKKSTAGCVAISEKMMKKFLISMKDGAQIYIYPNE